MSPDELAEALWGTAPPPSARVTLQNYVCGCGRRWATPRPDRHPAGGYLIRVAADELDVTRFETIWPQRGQRPATARGTPRLRARRRWGCGEASRWLTWARMSWRFGRFPG